MTIDTKAVREHLVAMVRAAADQYYQEGPRCRCPSCQGYRTLLKLYGRNPDISAEADWIPVQISDLLGCGEEPKP